MFTELSKEEIAEIFDSIGGINLKTRVNNKTGNTPPQHLGEKNLF